MICWPSLIFAPPYRFISQAASCSQETFWRSRYLTPRSLSHQVKDLLPPPLTQSLGKLRSWNGGHYIERSGITIRKPCLGDSLWHQHTRSISCDAKQLNPHRGAIRLHHALRQKCLSRSAVNLKGQRLWDQEPLLFSVELCNLLYSFGWSLHGCCGFPRHMKVECYIFASISGTCFPQSTETAFNPSFLHCSGPVLPNNTTLCSVDLLVILSNVPRCFNVSTMHSVPVLGRAHIVWWTA